MSLGVWKSRDFPQITMENGILVCKALNECGDKAWCDHRASFVNHLMDAEMYQSMKRANIPGGGIIVPLFPDLNVWAGCKIKPVSSPEDGEILDYHIYWIPPKYTPFAAAGESFDLGEISPGEGILTWAAQIWEIVEANAGSLTPHIIACQGSLHKNYVQQFKKNIQAPDLRFAETWSFFCTKRCLSCQATHNQWLAGDDLIPEIEGRGFPKTQEAIAKARQQHGLPTPSLTSMATAAMTAAEPF